MIAAGKAITVAMPLSSNDTSKPIEPQTKGKRPNAVPAANACCRPAARPGIVPLHTSKTPRNLYRPPTERTTNAAKHRAASIGPMEAGGRDAPCRITLPALKGKQYLLHDIAWWLSETPSKPIRVEGADEQGNPS